MRATKIRLLFAVFIVCFVILFFRSVSSCSASSSDDCTKLVGESHHIFAFVSAPRTTPRTANMCDNTLPCFAPLDDRGDGTN